jgi:hypothetical protein
MTEENKKIIVKDYLTRIINVDTNERIIINVIDDYSSERKPWVKIFYSVIRTKNNLHTKLDKVWSEKGTFNSLFVSEIRDQKLNDLGI